MKILFFFFYLFIIFFNYKERRSPTKRRNYIQTKQGADIPLA